MRHTANHSGNTETEGDDGSDGGREVLGLVVITDNISLEATLEDEVVAKRDALVDGQPVTDEVHEIVQNGLEVRISGNCNGNVACSGDTGPDETGNALSPAAKDLDGQTDGVEVGAVVGNDGQSKDDQAEFAETAEVGNKHRAEEATSARLFVSFIVDVVAAVDSSGSHDSNSKELSEEQRNDQAKESPSENLVTALGWRLIDGVVGGVRGPTRGEAVHSSTERKAVAQFRSTNTPRNVHEVSSVSKDAESDEEDDGGRDPRPELVNVDNLVAEESDGECEDGNDDDTSPTRNVGVDSVDQLCSNNGVHGGPANASQDVEDGNELSSPPTEPES